MAAATKREKKSNLPPKMKKTHVCLYRNCGKAFSRKYRLEIHVRTHTGERPFRCDFDGCDKSYARHPHLVRHVEHAHQTVTKEEFICPYAECKDTFVSATNLRRHVGRRHENLHYKCPYAGCEKIFKKHQHLKSHEYVHTNIRPFACHHEGCKAAFLVNNKLKHHMKFHEGYTCEKEGCSKHFEKWTQLRKHVAADHKSEHLCPSCHKSFPHRRILVRHMVIHEETRPVFVCPKEDCTRVYYEKRNLTAHLKSYHDGKRFPCSHEGCGRSYVSKQKMLDHAKIHDPAVALAKKKPRKRKASRKISAAAVLSGYDVRKHSKIEPDKGDVIVILEESPGDHHTDGETINNDINDNATSESGGDSVEVTISTKTSDSTVVLHNTDDLFDFSDSEPFSPPDGSPVDSCKVAKLRADRDDVVRMSMWTNLVGSVET